MQTAVAGGTIPGDKVFDEILEALKSIDDELPVKRMEELVHLMKQTAHTASFTTHYKSFACIVANHCTQLTTYVARLAEFLPNA